MDNSIEFIVEEEMQGTRLDVVLSFVIDDVSRSYLQKLIETKSRVNGSEQSKYKVKTGILSKYRFKPETLDVVRRIFLSTLYMRMECFGKNKPKGMVVHPAAGNYTEPW